MTTPPFSSPLTPTSSNLGSFLPEYASAGHVQKLRRALVNGADPNERNTNNDTALHRALGRTDQQTCAMITMLVESGADVEAYNNAGETPLHLYLRLDRPLSHVIALLDAGANPGALSNNNNGLASSPLEIAIVRHNTSAFDLLLRRGAPVNGRQDKAWTPLHRAMALGHPNMVERLLASGADLNAVDGFGRKPEDVIVKAAIPGLEAYRIQLEQAVLAQTLDENRTMLGMARARHRL